MLYVPVSAVSFLLNCCRDDLDIVDPSSIRRRHDLPLFHRFRLHYQPCLNPLRNPCSLIVSFAECIASVALLYPTSCFLYLRNASTIALSEFLLRDPNLFPALEDMPWALGGDTKIEREGENDRDRARVQVRVTVTVRVRVRVSFSFLPALSTKIGKLHSNTLCLLSLLISHPQDPRTHFPSCGALTTPSDSHKPLLHVS